MKPPTTFGMEQMQAALDAANARAEKAEAQMRKLHAAALALVGRLVFVHNHPDYKSVWEVNQLHAGPYTGPKYETELAAQREVLKNGICRLVYDAIAEGRDNPEKICAEESLFGVPPDLIGEAIARLKRDGHIQSLNGKITATKYSEGA